MMMTQALERAVKANARAFYEAEALDEPIFFETYGGRSVNTLVEEFWPEFVPETRAVLMAVREPDRDIVNLGINAGHQASGMEDVLHLPSAFIAMIDAILEQSNG